VGKARKEAKARKAQGDVGQLASPSLGHYAALSLGMGHGVKRSQIPFQLSLLRLIDMKGKQNGS